MNTDRTIANAQIALSCIYIVGYFTMLAMILLGYIRTPPEWKDVLGALVSVLTAAVLQIVNFWFSRQRPQTPSA